MVTNLARSSKTPKNSQQESNYENWRPEILQPEIPQSKLPQRRWPLETIGLLILVGSVCSSVHIGLAAETTNCANSCDTQKSSRRTSTYVQGIADHPVLKKIPYVVRLFNFFHGDDGSETLAIDSTGTLNFEESEVGLALITADSIASDDRRFERIGVDFDIDLASYLTTNAEGSICSARAVEPQTQAAQTSGTSNVAVPCGSECLKCFTSACNTSVCNTTVCNPSVCNTTVGNTVACNTGLCASTGCRPAASNTASFAKESKGAGGSCAAETSVVQPMNLPNGSSVSVPSEVVDELIELVASRAELDATLQIRNEMSRLKDEFMQQLLAITRDNAELQTKLQVQLVREELRHEMLELLNENAKLKARLEFAADREEIQRSAAKLSLENDSLRQQMATLQKELEEARSTTAVPERAARARSRRTASDSPPIERF